MRTSQLAGPFDFTKEMPILKIDALKDARRIPIHDNKRFDPGVGTTLYDLQDDPKQMKPFRDPRLEERITAGIHDVLAAHDTPPEFYVRYGLKHPGAEPGRTTTEGGTAMTQGRKTA
jgi:hypothetical protein